MQIVNKQNKNWFNNSTTGNKFNDKFCNCNTSNFMINNHLMIVESKHDINSSVEKW